MAERRALPLRAPRAPRRLRLVRGYGRPQPARDVTGGVASLVLPGLGQLRQGRRGAAAAHVAVLALLLVGCAAARAPRRATAALVGAWTLASAGDAARRAPRPPLRRL